MQEIDASQALNDAFKLHLAGDLPRAEILYCHLIAHDESHWAAYFGLGTLYAQSSANGRAIAFLRRSLELRPGNPEALANLAAVYRRLENKELARDLNLQSLGIERTASALSNMAGTYINDGDPKPALAYADEALDVSPGFAEAGNHKALALLEMGEFDKAWPEYDARFRVSGWHTRPYTCPQWAGEQVETLAISGEQGLGDEIMFLTALRQVQPFAKNIVIECATRLVRLIHNSFPEVRVYGTYDELAKHEKPDAWTHMGSMQRWIWPVKPNAYLKPRSAYTRGPGQRVGISWRGGTMATHERLRNFKLDYWRHLIVPGTISLQYGPREADAKELGIPHDSTAIGDIDRLAAMIKSCDLVVSVCNTTVHLAGALGVPCICLVPSKPAWRYGLTGDKMVWYDSVQLIRQGNNEDWRSVIDRVRQAVNDHGIVSGTEQAAA